MSIRECVHPAPDYEAIAKRWLPRGYAVEYRKGLCGMHYGGRALIKVPRPTTPESLYIFLHECAHAYLHTGSGKRTPTHAGELEAELWAHAKMAEHGIPVPPKITEQGKQYVARKIVQAERRGGKYFDPRAIEFAGDYIAAWRAQYDRLYGPQQLAAARERLAALRARYAVVRESQADIFWNEFIMSVAPCDKEEAKEERCNRPRHAPF